jgi:hypothetical protein
MSAAVSGDLCRFVGRYGVEHYRCDEYADGTITNQVNGTTTTPAPEGALKGFEREARPPQVGVPSITTSTKEQS